VRIEKNQSVVTVPRICSPIVNLHKTR